MEKTMLYINIINSFIDDSVGHGKRSATAWSSVSAYI